MILQDRIGELAMLGWVDDVDAASHDCDRHPAAVERALMGFAVDSTGEAAYDAEPLGSQL